MVITSDKCCETCSRALDRGDSLSFVRDVVHARLKLLAQARKLSDGGINLIQVTCTHDEQGTIGCMPLELG